MSDKHTNIIQSNQERRPQAEQFIALDNNCVSASQKPGLWAGMDNLSAYPEYRGKLELRDAWTRWLARYDWQWFVTLTFKNEIHPEAARKLFGMWIHGINRKLYGQKYHKCNQGIYWVVALEYQKRGVIHFHALLGDDKNINTQMRRKNEEARWEQLAGFAMIRPILEKLTAVTSYVSKYVIKDGEIEVSKTLMGLAAFGEHTVGNFRLTP